MAFPTAVNDQITDAVVKEVASSSGMEEDSARKVVETVINLLESKEVLRKDASYTLKKE